jgi:hypothetical protein
MKLYAVSLLLALQLSCYKGVTSVPVFYLTFQWPNNTEPIGAKQCDISFQSIHDAVYQTYVQEVISDTALNYKDVTQIDPDWQTINSKACPMNRTVRNLRTVSQAVQQQRQEQRRLSCAISICDDGRYIIMLNGCVSLCSRYDNRRELMMLQNHQTTGSTIVRTNTMTNKTTTTTTTTSISQKNMTVTSTPQNNSRNKRRRRNGNKYQIDWSQPGARTAKSVYKTIDSCMPQTNKCQRILNLLEYTVNFIDSSKL